MAIATQRPDVLAHRESLRLDGATLASELVSLIGRKLTAYVAGVKDVRAVERWMEGGQIYGGAEERLRLTFQVARMLTQQERQSVVQAWFLGMNPELGDRSPLRLLRDEPLEKCGPEVLSAARAFLAHG